MTSLLSFSILLLVLVQADYVPDFDRRCWACLLDVVPPDTSLADLDLFNHFYCASDDRCYTSINDTCTSRMAIQPLNCLKLAPEETAKHCQVLQFSESNRNKYESYTVTVAITPNSGC